MTDRILTIKLISPKMSLRPMDSELKRRMSPSLSLVMLASLTPEPHYVFIEDENTGPLNFNDRPDLVGITVNVDTASRAFEISGLYRAKGVKVIFGGILAGSDPDFLSAHCDAVCIGEAENVWPDILDDLLHHSLKKRYHSPLPADLAKLPFPDWSFVPKKKYLYTNIITTSRGCPFTCDFCYNSCEYVNNTYRNRPVDRVIEEIGRLSTRQVMFIDDNLIGNLEWFLEFVEALTPLGIVWHAAVTTNLVRHPGLIGAMARSGCRSLFIGFESINPESISSVKKKQNRVHEYETLIGMLHDHGIMVNASLVFGFDHDTPEIFSRTLEWLVANKVETMTGHILTPYPGTALYKRLAAENRIIDHDLRKYNTANVVFQPMNMTPAELRAGYLGMYRQFYSLKNILKRRPVRRNLALPYFMFNFGYRKYGRITSLLGRLGLMNTIGRLGRRLAYGID